MLLRDRFYKYSAVNSGDDIYLIFRLGKDPRFAEAFIFPWRHSHLRWFGIQQQPGSVIAKVNETSQKRALQHFDWSGPFFPMKQSISVTGVPVVGNTLGNAGRGELHSMAAAMPVVTFATTTAAVRSTSCDVHRCHYAHAHPNWLTTCIYLPYL